MASYVVLARKWRPAQFSDLVGQTHVVRTLMNAIQANRLHPGYLLTGSRGIGKTSIARIFAKAVRCPNVRTTEGKEPWLASCDQCPSCQEIAQGNSVDVIEIDGASNNGVDAVREIRENAKYMPAIGGRKIYIIDEVHMLTTAAFNALLKTLEEPPAHVMFIFATTEPHKIPGTILSRCQRYDLRRVTLAQIQGRLTQVCQSEGIEAEAGALALVARAAEGSMRDSLSLLDQVIAFSGQKLTTQSTREAIGLIEGQTMIAILRGVLGRKPLDALAAVEQAYQQGHDLKILTRSLIEFLYGVILAKIGSTGSASLELSPDEWNELQELAPLRPLEEMELIFQALHHGVEWIARSPQPKIVLDVLLIKCATADALVTLEPAHPSAAPAPRPAASQATPPPKPVATQSAAPQLSTQLQSLMQPKAAPEAQPVRAPEAPLAPAPQALGPRTFEGLISHVKRSRPLLATFLEHAHCDALPEAGTPGQDTLGLCFSAADSSFRDQLQNRVFQEQLVALGKEYFGFGIRLRFGQGDVGESPAVRRQRELRAREEAARSAVHTHPIITEARSLFGGELGPIELIDGEEGGSPRATH